jgi:hypothetical protein
MKVGDLARVVQGTPLYALVGAAPYIRAWLQESARALFQPLPYSIRVEIRLNLLQEGELAYFKDFIRT